MKGVFFGSSDFSVPFLESVKEHILLVITTPDRRKNRGKKLLPNPVKAKAVELGIRVIDTDFFDQSIEQEIKKLNPDIFVVVSYGKIIPHNILSIPKCAINLHPSNLPMYRGAAPIERQIMDGVTDSAVCIIKVSEKLDRGDIILSEPLKIEFEDTKEDVEKKVIKIGAHLLIKAMELVVREGCSGRKQVGKGSYAKKITRDDEYINWDEDAIKIYNRIRALYPVPGARTTFRGKVLKIFRATIAEEKVTGNPGHIRHINKDSFTVSCKNSALKILEVQIEGKRRVSVRDFINGTHLEVGEKLG